MRAIQQWPKRPSNFIFLIFVVVLTSLNPRLCLADVIKFGVEELPRESVMPVFDNPEAVKSKYVPFEHRFELGIFGGATTNDPINNTVAFGGELLYHFSDIHAFGVVGSYHITSQTQYVPQLLQIPGATASIPFDQSSSPQMCLFGEYEFTPYYGKVSLSKQTVMNMTVSAIVGGGMISQTSSRGTDSGFGFELGLNQRLFFTRNFGMKLDIKALFYNQYDVIPVTPSRKLFTNVLLGLGVVYLIPSL